MAKFSAGIDTVSTGALELTFEMSENRAQDIFAMLLETSAPITREREVDGVIEHYQDARGLGECLRGEITTFIGGIEIRAIEHKKRKASIAAIQAVKDTPEVEEVTP